MILSDAGIKHALEVGQLEILPSPEEDQYTTSAVDLFLGNVFQSWDEKIFKVPGTKIDLNLAEQSFSATAKGFMVHLPLEKDGCFVLPPYQVSPRPVLAMTRETIHLKPGSKLAARVEGRSSLARLGLVVHLTAPTIHANFNAPITLEMINHGPFHLRLVPGRTRVCQLILERLETQPAGEIKTGFQHQTSPAGKN
jgi:dCTP deaminase